MMQRYAIFVIVGFIAILLAIANCAAPQEKQNVSALQSSASPSPSPTSSFCTLSGKLPQGVTPVYNPPLNLAATPTHPPIAGHSQLVETRFYSALLDREMPIAIFLPPGYADSSRRYPTLYMLGGFNGDYREWTYWGICHAADTLIRRGHIQPLIIVMPEGEFSYWFNHAQVEGSDGKPWGDYIWKDVVNFADSNYRTIPHRASRAIGGLSAGGQSALMLAMTQPQVFSVAGAHSPSIRGADGSLAFFGSPQYFQQYDIVWLMRHTYNWRELSLWIDVGKDDTQWGGPIRDFHKMLEERGIPHEWRDEWEGKHDQHYWSAHLGDYLTWYASKLAGE